MMKLKVKEHPHLIRDSHSKAILNVDNDAYREYQSKKNVQNKIINMSSEIEELKTSVNEIKDLLLQITSQRIN